MFLVVLGLGAYLLWNELKYSANIPAYVMRRIHLVGAPQRGVVGQIKVNRGDRVRKGQVIAVLDPTMVKADLAIAVAESKRLESLIASTAVQFLVRRASVDARLTAFSVGARRELLSGAADLRRWRAELKEVKLEVAWLSRIERNVLGRSTRIAGLRAKQRVLEERIRSAPGLLRLYRSKKRAAGRLLGSLRRRQTSRGGKRGKGGKGGGELAAVLKPLELLLAKQRLRIARLELRRSRLTLRSPVDGLVRDVRQRRGDRVDASAPVATVVEDDPVHVVAYLKEDIARRIEVGYRVKAHIKNPPNTSLLKTILERRAIWGRVIGLGDIGPIPLRFRTVPRKPLWVRSVMIKLDSKHKLIPGEQMLVSFHKPGSTGLPDGTATAARGVAERTVSDGR